MNSFAGDLTHASGALVAASAS
jgi:hypothetical protein